MQPLGQNSNPQKSHEKQSMAASAYETDQGCEGRGKIPRACWSASIARLSSWFSEGSCVKKQGEDWGRCLLTSTSNTHTHMQVSHTHTPPTQIKARLMKTLILPVLHSCSPSRTLHLRYYVCPNSASLSGAFPALYPWICWNFPRALKPPWIFSQKLSCVRSSVSLA